MYKLKSFARSTLAGSISALATELTIRAGEGDRFPLGVTEITVYDSDNFANPTDAFLAGQCECMIVTRSGDTFKILNRGIDGTTALAFNTETTTYTVLISNSATLLKGLNWFDVENFGADSSGLTDSTQAIIDTFKALPEEGGIVFFPLGVFSIEGPSSVIEVTKSNVTICGTGNGSVIRAAAQRWKNIFQIEAQNHVHLRDLRIEKASANSVADGRAITFVGVCKDCSVERVAVDMFSTAFEVDGSKGIIPGISERITLRDCQVTNSEEATDGGSGIELSHVDGVTISGCHVSGQFANGLEIYTQVRHCVVDETVRFEKCRQEDVAISPDPSGPIVINQLVEGVPAYAAGPGSIARRTDGGSNATLYVKETGFGVTGWTAK